MDKLLAFLDILNMHTKLMYFESQCLIPFMDYRPKTQKVLFYFSRQDNCTKLLSKLANCIL